jgi:hypothetical protein
MIHIQKLQALNRACFSEILIAEKGKFMRKGRFIYVARNEKEKGSTTKKALYGSITWASVCHSKRPVPQLEAPGRR